MSAHMTLRGNGRTYVSCATYEASAPILSLDNPGAALSIYIGAKGSLDAGDLRFARALAAAAVQFRNECERMHAAAAAAEPPESLPLSA